MPRSKAVIHPKRGEITAYAQDMARGLDGKLLEEQNRTVAISCVSALLQQKFPLIPRETRRQVAAEGQRDLDRPRADQAQGTGAAAGMAAETEEGHPEDGPRNTESSAENIKEFFVMARDTTYYLFDRFPGLWPKWTLAVLAVSQADARAYVKATHRGGTLCGTVTGETVNAHCGAVTPAAQEILHEKMERLMAGDFEQETYF